MCVQKHSHFAEWDFASVKQLESADQMSQKMSTKDVESLKFSFFFLLTHVTMACCGKLDQKDGQIRNVCNHKEQNSSEMWKQQSSCVIQRLKRLAVIHLFTLPSLHDEGNKVRKEIASTRTISGCEPEGDKFDFKILVLLMTSWNINSIINIFHRSCMICRKSKRCVWWWFWWSPNNFQTNVKVSWINQMYRHEGFESSKP